MLIAFHLLQKINPAFGEQRLKGYQYNEQDQIRSFRINRYKGVCLELLQALRPVEARYRSASARVTKSDSTINKKLVDFSSAYFSSTSVFSKGDCAAGDVAFDFATMNPCSRRFTSERRRTCEAVNVKRKIAKRTLASERMQFLFRLNINRL